MTQKERLTTIRLSGKLGQKFGKTHKFYVSSAGEAVRALCSQLEGFTKYMQVEGSAIRYSVFVGDKKITPEKELNELSGSKEIRIAPVIAGAKQGVLQTILGAVLIVVGFVLTFTPFAAAAPYFYTMGAGMMLGGVVQMLSPQPKLNISEAPNNTPNTGLGVVNTSSAGRPVPLVYGEAVVGSSVISAGIVSADINY